jgi:hypothetical protein
MAIYWGNPFQVRLVPLVEYFHINSLFSVAKLLWSDLRDAGYIELALPLAMTNALVDLEACAKRYVVSLPAETKASLAKVLDNSISDRKSDM